VAAVLEAGPRAYLDGVALRLEREAGVRPTAVLAHGEVAPAVQARADALGADLVVLTTHGRGGLGRVFFGSVADSVLRHSSCPVLLVRVKEAG